MLGDPVPAGTPFGNTDFRAYNIDFINDYKNYATGPSLAVSVSYANTGFYFCGFYSYQDTVDIPIVSIFKTSSADPLMKGVYRKARERILLQK